MKTGNTGQLRSTASSADTPQWSPAMKTGNTTGLHTCARRAVQSLNGARP